MFSSRAEFFAAVLALVTKFPAILPKLKAWWELTVDIYDDVIPAQEVGTLGLEAMSVGEQALLDQIAAASQGEGGSLAMVDLTFLLTMYRVAQAAPEVAALLKKLFAKKG